MGGGLRRDIFFLGSVRQPLVARRSRLGLYAVVSSLFSTRVSISRWRFAIPPICVQQRVVGRSHHSVGSKRRPIAGASQSKGTSLKAFRHLPHALHAPAKRASYPRSGKAEKIVERFYGRRMYVEKIGTFEPAHLAVLMNERHRARALSRSKGCGGGGGRRFTVPLWGTRRAEPQEQCRDACPLRRPIE